MVGLAQKLDHPFSLAFALSVGATFHQIIREVESYKKHTRALARLATDKGFAFYQTNVAIYRGMAQVEEGQVEEGIARMQQGIAAYRATGTEFHRPQVLALLVEVYKDACQFDIGLRVVSEALILVEETGERFYEAELHRLKGELLLGIGGEEVEAEGEASFGLAIHIAQQQQARSWQLRATMSLARLWQKQGKKDEARNILSDIYGWFTEGFDTPDLKDAKALLEELS
jgi:predicted ATPase